MKHRLLVAASAAALALAAAACGDDGTVPEAGGDAITVSDAWARSPMQDVGAVYFVAHNGAGEEDRLVGVSSSAAGRAEMHEMVEQDGQMVMQPVDSIAIGPGEEVTFEPGGYHIMLFELTEPLEVDPTIDVLLEFENAGAVELEAVVEPYVPEEEGMDMGDGEMSQAGSDQPAREP